MPDEQPAPMLAQNPEHPGLIAAPATPSAAPPRPIPAAKVRILVGLKTDRIAYDLSGVDIIATNAPIAFAWRPANEPRD